MTEAQFTKLNQTRWTDFEALLRQRASRRFNLVQDAWNYPRAYRQLCRDLNMARSERYSLELIAKLNRLVWEGHQLLYRRRSQSPAKSLIAFATDFPSTLRRFGMAFLLCHMLFYGVAGLAFLYGRSDTSHVEAFLGSETMASLKESYDPSNGHFLHPRGVETDADMFGFYIWNNISIGFRTFAGGALAGIGSLFFLVFNALFMGAAMAYIDHLGFNGTFYPFILGHGAFELTAIIIFSLAGFELGKAIIMPGRLSRIANLRLQGQAVLPLVIGGTIFLFIAACLEAFWSSRPTPVELRYGVAAGLWVLVYGFILLGGKRARTGK